MNINNKQASSRLLFALGIYLLVIGTFATYLIIDVWSEQFLIFRLLFPLVSLTKVDVPTLKTLSYIIAGSVLGAVILSFKGLHIHGAVKAEFRVSYSGSYLIGPWAAGLLGIAVYGLTRGGLLLLGGTKEFTDPTAATQFAYLGLGFLIGFAWDKVLTKLDSLAHQIFGKNTEVQSSANEISNSTTQDQGESSEKK